MPRGAKAFRKAVTGGSKDEDEEPETASTPVPAPKPKEAPTPKAQAQDAPVDESDEGSESGSKKETKGQMAQRHKRELRDLKEKIKKMGKKGKDEAEKLEKELEKRHVAELAALETEATAEADGAAAAVEGLSLERDGRSDAAAKKKGKAQAKRAKRAAEDAEREARIQAELANLGETERMVEEEKLRRVLVPLGLYIRDIPSDGHCLFRSVEDQLEFTGDPAPVPYPELRKRCAAHMQAHPADFLPFLDLDEEGESAESGEEGVERPQRSEEQRFEAYCARMGGSAVWGGQLEVRALAQALQRHIIVYAADMPPVDMGEEFKGAHPPLRLTYHRHMYTMGEHFNSCRSLEGHEESGEDSD